MDINDNAPQFDRLLYETSLAKNAMIGSLVLTVFAEDNDSPGNSQITYSIASDETAPIEHHDDFLFFKIANPTLGEITLVQKILLNENQERFMFSIIATDNGNPESRTTSVPVIVKVHEHQQNAPQWQSSIDCKDSMFLDEDIKVLVFKIIFKIKLFLDKYNFASLSCYSK